MTRGSFGARRRFGSMQNSTYANEPKQLVESTGVEKHKEFLPFTFNYKDRKAIDKAMEQTKYADR